MHHLTSAAFEEEIFECDRPVVIMFYALWCGKCSIMKSIIEEMEIRYKKLFKFCELNIEEQEQIASDYEIDIVPTFIFIKNGEILASFSGIIAEDTFEKRIKEIFRNC